MVGLNSSEEITRNFSKSDIDYSAKMFVALWSCPSFYEKLYRQAIYGPKSRIAMLAANILKKSKGDFKLKAQKIFAKISSVLGFQMLEYQHIFHDRERNESMGSNILLTKDMFDIQGQRP